MLKKVFEVRLHIVSAKADLFIAQYGFLFMSAGCILMALSQSLGAFISGRDLLLAQLTRLQLTVISQGFSYSHLVAAHGQLYSLY